MEKSVIHIYGASGSGTTTLARYLTENLGYRLIDSDDYYWENTDPPYRQKRPIPERIRLMKEELKQSPKAVISGSLTDWGDPLIPFFYPGRPSGNACRGSHCQNQRAGEKEIWFQD